MSTDPLTSSPSGNNGTIAGLNGHSGNSRPADLLLQAPDWLPESQTPIPDLDALTPVERLVYIAEADCEFFRDDRGENFARCPVDNHFETHPLESGAFQDCLIRQYRTMFHKVPSRRDIKEASYILGAKARLDGPVRTLEVRVADDSDGNVWYDMADPEQSAVLVTKMGCQFIHNPPSLFRRYKTSKAQVMPVLNPIDPAATLELLRPFVNVQTDSQFRLLIVWLVATLLSLHAHPVLMIHGPQGTAKSTLARMLQALIDPSNAPLLAEPRDLGQWMQIADHRWLVVLDNVSQVPVWLSDALCRAVTGESFSKRKLFTDSDDVVITFRRPIILTSIEVVTQRSDLLERSLLIGTVPIRGDERRAEADLAAQFEAIRPAIIGALLATVSGVLFELPNVKMNRMPRMADFAQIGVAVERVLGFEDMPGWENGSFMAAYDGSLAEQHCEAIAASPLAARLVKFFNDWPGMLPWSGTADRLLTRLQTDMLVKDRDWPKSPRALSAQLRRVLPNLNAMGFDVQFKRNREQREIIISKREPEMEAS